MTRVPAIARTFLCLAAPLVLLAPASRAQSVGRIECPRSDGYVYLYSSMTTLEVRNTLPCGAQVQITGRYDRYFGVRTAKGEVGFVPQTVVLLIKDADAPKSLETAPAPSRERTMYDAAPPAPPAPVVRLSPNEFILPTGTVINLKLTKGLSSAVAKLGDHVDLEVAQDLVIDGITVVAKGAPAVGTVTDVELKKRMGHGGKVGVSLNSVRLVSNDNAPIRGYQETQGANSAAGGVLPVLSGKDVAFAPGTDFKGWVDGDVHLKRDAFAPAKQDAAATSAQAAPHN